MISDELQDLSLIPYFCNQIPPLIITTLEWADIYYFPLWCNMSLLLNNNVASRTIDRYNGSIQLDYKKAGNLFHNRVFLSRD